MTDLHIALTEKRRLVDPEAPKVACVYKITGPTGKLYIGKTVSPLKRRLENHERCARHAAKPNAKRRMSYLGNAIQKHGRKAFTIECILVGTEAYCFEMEPKLIAAYGTQAPHGYNVGEGGEGWSSADFQRWYKTPAGREACAKGAEVSAHRAGYPQRRVHEVLENAKEWLSYDSIATKADVTRIRARHAIIDLNRKKGLHIICVRGLYRLFDNAENAAMAWPGGPEMTIADRILKPLMEGPRTNTELMTLLGIPYNSADACIQRLRGRGYTLESRGARGSISGTFHLIQDERHPWLHLGVMDLRAAHDDRERCTRHFLCK